MSPKLLNILLILVPVLLYFGYIHPIYTGEPGLVWTPEKNIFVLRSLNVQYQNSINQISLIQNQMDQLNKDYNAVDEETKKKIGIMLPDTINPIKLRSEVASIADKSGTAITDIVVVPINSNIRNGNQKLSGYKVSFSTKAHYPVLKSLISNYEKNMRLFILESIAIDKIVKKPGEENKIEVDDDDETLTSAITFNVYYLK